MHCLNKLRQQWTNRKSGLFKMLFVEEKREKRRLQKGRMILTDIFFYSSSDDYYLLRLLYNLPIGFGIAMLIYHLAWYRVNFADSILIDSFWKEFVKWSMITFSALSYSLNPLVRASLSCSLFSGLSSSGQGIISVFVIEKLNQGPINNILQNFNISTVITVCHLELQARITKRRIELQAGPMEALFEKNFGNITTIGHKVVQTLKSLIQPFDEDVEENTDEDAHLAAIIDTAQVINLNGEVRRHVGRKKRTGEWFPSESRARWASLAEDKIKRMAWHWEKIQKLADRQLLTEGEDSSGYGKLDRATKPAWKRLKSQLGRSIARRFERRCKYMFASSVEACHKKLQDSQSLCYDSVPWPLDSFACSRINALSLCQARKVGEMSTKFCELGQSVDSGKEEHEMLFSPELDGQMHGLQNVSDQIKRQLQLNLHFQVIEQPEIERGYSLIQLNSELKHDVKILQVVLGTFNVMLDFVVVMFTYFIFKNCVQTTLRYLNDIEFKNSFTTPYFWRIDKKRQDMGKVYMRPLRKAERKHNKVISPYGLPRSDEIKKMVSSFVRWSVLAFVVAVVVMVDYFFFKLLEIVVTHGKVLRHQKGSANLNIVVNGTGAIAELLRNVLQMNYSQQLDEHLDNLYCLDKNNPSKPEWNFNILYLVVPLAGMLVLQVFFNFVVQRFVLFFVLGLMFPRRAKARIIHLYNKILLGRVNLTKMEDVKEKVKAEQNPKGKKKINNMNIENLVDN